MIDPLSSSAPPAPPARPAARTAPSTPEPTPVAAPAPPSAQTKRPSDHSQLAMEVKKADDGVFVYTLSDPDTHAVIVVIPRKDVDGSQEGQALDRRV